MTPTEALVDAVQCCVAQSPYVLTPFGENGEAGRGVMCDQPCWHAARRAVKDYAAHLRALDIAPERGLAAMKDALRSAIPALDPKSVLMVSAGPWLLDGYYSADRSLGT